eukprot:2419412-Ditylum_brightwellii.AAC.1
MATTTDVPLNLSTTFGNDTSPRHIKRKEPFESIRQLGLKNNPAANFRDAIKAKSHISKAVTHRLKSSLISSKNAYCLYRNIWLPEMQYSLAATSFNKALCIQIMKQFVYAILPKLGFNRNIAQIIIYSSKQYGGFQLVHLYLEQGYLLLKHLLGYLREET